MLVFQSTDQLEKLYGKEGVRAWNSSVAARVYGCGPTDQAELFRMIGEYTIDIEGQSKSTGLRGLGIGTPSTNITMSINLQKANFMQPKQLRTLPNDGLVLFYKGQNPMICGMACGKACKDDPLGGKSASSLTHLVWLQKLLFAVQRWKGKRG